MSRSDPSRRALLAGAATAPFLARPAVAQGGWPARPIRLLVPFGAGGPTDVVARLLAEPAASILQRPVVVENRPGAGGNIGTRLLAAAAPDGNTVGLTAAGPLVINEWLYADLGYDPAASLAPLSRLTTGPLLLVTGPASPYRSVGDLLEDARRRPGALNYATAGNGTVPHLATELFLHAAGARMQHVPYRAAPQATGAAMQGDVALSFDSMTSLEAVRSGSLRALAVSSPARFPGAPEIPTIPEAGGPASPVEAWYGLVLPSGTPADRAALIHAAFVTAVRAPSLRDRLTPLGFEAVGDDPGAFAAFVAAERAQWGRLIRSAGIRLE